MTNASRVWVLVIAVGIGSGVAVSAVVMQQLQAYVLGLVIGAVVAWAGANYGSALLARALAWLRCKDVSPEDM